MSINVSSTTTPRGQTPAPAVQHQEVATLGKPCYAVTGSFDGYIWFAINCLTGKILQEGESALYLRAVVPSIGLCVDDDNPWLEFSIRNGSTSVAELSKMPDPRLGREIPEVQFLSVLLGPIAGPVAISEVVKLRKKQDSDKQAAYRELERNPELQEARRTAYNLEMSKLNKL